MAKENNLIICNNFFEAINSLSDENAGKLFKTIFHYHLTGEVIEQTEIVNFAFLTFKDLIDQNHLKYEEKCKKNKQTIVNYWKNKRTNTNEYERIQTNTNIKENKIKEENIKENIINLNKPTRKQLEEYENQIGKHIGIDEFILYYDASDWCDKSGLPINWKQTALSWAKRNENEPKKRVNDGLF